MLRQLVRRVFGSRSAAANRPRRDPPTADPQLEGSERYAVAGRTGAGAGRGTVLLYAHVGPPPKPAVCADPGGTRRPPRPSRQRERILASELTALKLCSRSRCEALRKAGVTTAGDLLAADPATVARDLEAGRKAAQTLRRYRRAIRLAVSVPEMTPRDALLLMSVHRRSVTRLAAESPAALHRDLQRYALSSPGQRQLRGRELPSLDRVRGWVDACSQAGTGGGRVASAA